MPPLEGLALWQLGVILLLSGATVVAAGIVLARNGDVIADRTGLGGLFVGMLLMAAATSLPEIATDVTAAVAGAPALAIGDLFGSSMANMAILAVIDLVHRGRVWPATGLGHARVAAIAMALTAVVLIGIVSPSGIRIGWVGIEPIVVVVGYALAANWIRRSQQQRQPGPGSEGEELISPVGLDADTSGRPEPLRRHLLAFGGAAAVILIAAPLMALSAQAAAEQTGIAESFIGATILALATSLPELATSLAAVRIGAFDLAVGNLFGSNALNTTIVFFADAAFTSGPILPAVAGSGAVVAGLAAMLLMAIGIGGIVHGARARFQRGEPDAVMLLVTYGLLLWILWSGT